MTVKRISSISLHAVSVRSLDAPAPTGSSTTGRPSAFAFFPARNMPSTMAFSVPMLIFKALLIAVISSTSDASSAIVGDAPQASRIFAQSLAVT